MAFSSYNEAFGLGTYSEDANLESWHKMQEASGVTLDDGSTNARDATYTNGGANVATITGPTSWLTSAVDFDGSDDSALTSTDMVSGANWTIAGWFKVATYDANQRAIIFQGDAGTNGAQLSVNTELASATDCLLYRHTGGNIRYPVPGTTTDWHHFALVGNGSDTDSAIMYIDGSTVSGTRNSGSNQTINVNGTLNNYAMGRSGTNNSIDGGLAEIVSFSKNLTSAEVTELKNGPEPLNTVAPTVSGDTAQGSTLTAATGTWDSQNNGTITYTYQWTRDGSNISGATSSTYVTQAADVGTAVGCKVLGANDGGSDAAEETASSNTISVVSSGTTYRLNMQLFIPTQV